MPYSKVEPVDVSYMRKKKYHGHHTICETLREIYVLSRDEEIRFRCRIAMAMAKRMQDKLKEYKQNTK